MIRTEFNLDEANAAFARLEAALTDFTPLMEDLGEYFVETTKQRFKEGTSPEGVAWAPKSPATLAAYARRGDRKDARPLFGPSLELHKQIFHEATATGVEWGSNLIYSGVMQFGAAKGEFGRASNGSSIPWGNIPARPFIGVSESDMAYLIATIEAWIESASNGASTLS
jgi:phage gpG-like protein